MEALECIKTRRSVRRFTEQPVTREEIEQIVAAAAYAPSWKNTQIVRYIVLNDEQKAHLTDECMMDFAFNQKSARRAPMLIGVTLLTGRSGFERDGSFSTEKGTHWQSFYAGIAVQTFCLAAHALGLGTVVMGIFDDHKTAALLDIPEGQEVAAVLAIGHPAEEPMCPKRKSVDNLVSFR